MGFDQKGSTVFCVKHAESGQWEVIEEGFEKSLASFDSADDARKYANDLAKNQEGSSVKMLD
ncbi:MAG: DUF2188 domain-containing protein [Sulfuriferula sp.]